MATSATMPANTYADITPSNTRNMPREARAIYVGVGGNVKVTRIVGVTVTFMNVPSGFVLPVQAIKVWADSTATNMIALY